MLPTGPEYGHILLAGWFTRLPNLVNRTGKQIRALTHRGRASKLATVLFANFISVRRCILAGKDGTSYAEASYLFLFPVFFRERRIFISFV